jgi:hypothetical protein
LSIDQPRESIIKLIFEKLGQNDRVRNATPLENELRRSNQTKFGFFSFWPRSRASFRSITSLTKFAQDRDVIPEFTVTTNAERKMATSLYEVVKILEAYENIWTKRPGQHKKGTTRDKLRNLSTILGEVPFNAQKQGVRFTLALMVAFKVSNLHLQDILFLIRIPKKYDAKTDEDVIADRASLKALFTDLFDDLERLHVSLEQEKVLENLSDKPFSEYLTSTLKLRDSIDAADLRQGVRADESNGVLVLVDAKVDKDWKPPPCASPPVDLNQSSSFSSAHG